MDISINKARTARSFDNETKELADSSQPGGPFFGIHVSNGGRGIIAAGGIPLQRNGKIVGGIGISGGDGEQSKPSPRLEPAPSRHQAREEN